MAELNEENELNQAQQQCIENDEWPRPDLPITQPPQAGTTSVYAKPLSHFPVAHCPGYRRLGHLPADPKSSSDGPHATSLPSDEWERLFAEDVERLVSQVLIHICGESCYKYTKAKCTHICRHGFYYVVHLAGWQRRRKGKYLRNALFVVKQTKHGMQGRILGFQEHPFECMSNYASATVMRCNLDVQDLRRVLPEDAWLGEDEALPTLGGRPSWGYMQHYEWNGEEYEPRHRGGGTDCEPFAWEADMKPEQWRQVLLELLEKHQAGHHLITSFPSSSPPPLPPSSPSSSSIIVVIIIVRQMAKKLCKIHACKSCSAKVSPASATASTLASTSTPTPPNSARLWKALGGRKLISHHYADYGL